VGPTVYNERLGSYPGTKQAGRDVSHLPQPSADVEERVKLTSAPPLGLSGLL